jgi:hypothetical protein
MVPNRIVSRQTVGVNDFRIEEQIEAAQPANG